MAHYLEVGNIKDINIFLMLPILKEKSTDVIKGYEECPELKLINIGQQDKILSRMQTRRRGSVLLWETRICFEILSRQWRL